MSETELVEDDKTPLAKGSSEDAIILSAMMETGEKIMGKFADAQKFAATEQTKRAGAFLATLNRWMWPLFVLVAMFIGILGFSVYQGNYDFPEKVITGILAFAGGFVSRMALEKKPQS